MGAQWELQTARRGTQTSDGDSDNLNADIVGNTHNYYHETHQNNIFYTSLNLFIVIYDWPELPLFGHAGFYIAVYLV
jgi:hypothetical protein